MTLNAHHIHHSPFGYRMRVATHTHQGGIYMRDIDLPVSFGSTHDYHLVILDYLRAEGVPEFQLRWVNSEKLMYTCASTAEEGKRVESMSDVPFGSVLYFAAFCPAEARVLECPSMVRADAARRMLVTRDPEVLHVFFSGHRASLPFPMALDDADIVAFATYVLKDLGALFQCTPTVATVAIDDSPEAPRQMFTGRACLSSLALELIGPWRAIEPSMSHAPFPTPLQVRSHPRDALVPCP